MISTSQGRDTDFDINNAGNGNNGNNGNGNQDKPTGSDVKNTSTVIKRFVVDFSSETYCPLMEHEVNGLDYRYVYSDKARLSVVVQGIENGSASLLDDKGELHAYYHCDYLGTTDYLTSAVNSKVIAWTSYSEWGEITHNAVLKCGQRELDLVKEYATHDFDAVLNMYYAKARFYDADNRRFVAVDPILDASQYDLTAYTRTPVIYDQYIYVKNGPLIYIDADGEIFALVTGLVGAAAGAAVGAYKSYKDTGKVSLKSTLVGATVGAAVGVGAGALAGAALAGSATASTAAVASGAAKVATAAAATSVKSAAAAAATSVKTTAAAAAAKVGSAATAVATVANQIGEKVVQAAQQVGTQINNVTTQIAARLVTQPGVVGTVAQNSLTNPDVAINTVASGANVVGGFKTAYDYAVEGDYKNAALTLLNTAPSAFNVYVCYRVLTTPPISNTTPATDSDDAASSNTSKRLEYMGRTPGKNSRTGRAVIARMTEEGKIREFNGETQFMASDGKWYSIERADMSHRENLDAVTWWNETGRFYDPKAPEVRQFMLDPDNYVLELDSYNRSAGAILGQTHRYLPPA